MFVGCMVMARSQTALISLALLPVVAACTRIARLSGVTRMWAIYALAIGAITIAAALMLNLDAIIGIIGRDIR